MKTDVETSRRCKSREFPRWLGVLTIHPNKMSVQCVFLKQNLGSGCQTWGPLFQPKSNLLKLFIFLVFNNPALGGVPQKQRERGKGIFRRPTQNDQNAALLCSKLPPSFRGLCGTIAVESNTKQLHLQSLGLKKMGGIKCHLCLGKIEVDANVGKLWGISHVIEDCAGWQDSDPCCNEFGPKEEWKRMFWYTTKGFRTLRHCIRGNWDDWCLDN